MNLLASLPKRDALAEPAWNSRHRGILSILWFHVLGVPMFGVYMGAGPGLYLGGVGNALKFTEAGSVSVSVRPDEGDSGRMRIEVTDTGIGMPLDAQGKIFDSFSQADGSTTRKYGGTGLGLAIVKQLVGMMGGRLGLTSPPGQGTIFWFTIPIDTSPSRASESQQHSTPAAAHSDKSALAVTTRRQTDS